MTDLVAKFTGQAQKIVERKPSVFETLDDDPLGTRDLINKYVQEQIEYELDNGEYRIPRKQLIEADPIALEEMDRRLKEIAGERGLEVMVAPDFETNEYVVRWWKK